MSGLRGASGNCPQAGMIEMGGNVIRLVIIGVGRQGGAVVSWKPPVRGRRVVELFSKLKIVEIATVFAALMCYFVCFYLAVYVFELSYRAMGTTHACTILNIYIYIAI